jgi:ribosome-interacting GTPase 1
MCVPLVVHLLVHGLYNKLDVYNKIDSISLEQTDKLAREPNTVVISCEMDLKLENVFVLSLNLTHRLLCSLDYLIDRIWDELRLVKIYTKKRGAHPDLSDPICLRRGATIEARPSVFNVETEIVFLISALIGCLQWNSSISCCKFPI